MSNAEIAKDIIVAMITSKCFDVVNNNYTDSITTAYETIYNKIVKLNSNH